MPKHYNGFPLMVKYDQLFAALLEELKEFQEGPYCETKRFLGRTKDGIEFQLLLTNDEDDFLESESTIIKFAD
jgi:hypothetical protein